MFLPFFVFQTDFLNVDIGENILKAFDKVMSDSRNSKSRDDDAVKHFRSGLTQARKTFMKFINIKFILICQLTLLKYQIMITFEHLDDPTRAGKFLSAILTESNFPAREVTDVMASALRYFPNYIVKSSKLIETLANEYNKFLENSSDRDQEHHFLLLMKPFVTACQKVNAIVSDDEKVEVYQAAVKDIFAPKLDESVQKSKRRKPRNTHPVGAIRSADPHPDVNQMPDKDVVGGRSSAVDEVKDSDGGGDGDGGDGDGEEHKSSSVFRDVSLPSSSSLRSAMTDDDAGTHAQATEAAKTSAADLDTIANRIDFMMKRDPSVRGTGSSISLEVVRVGASTPLNHPLSQLPSIKHDRDQHIVHHIQPHHDDIADIIRSIPPMHAINALPVWTTSNRASSTIQPPPAQLRSLSAKSMPAAGLHLQGVSASKWATKVDDVLIAMAAENTESSSAHPYVIDAQHASFNPLVAISAKFFKWEHTPNKRVPWLLVDSMERFSHSITKYLRDFDFASAFPLRFEIDVGTTVTCSRLYDAPMHMRSYHIQLEGTTIYYIVHPSQRTKLIAMLADKLTSQHENAFVGLSEQDQEPRKPCPPNLANLFLSAHGMLPTLSELKDKGVKYNEIQVDAGQILSIPGDMLRMHLNVPGSRSTAITFLDMPVDLLRDGLLMRYLRHHFYRVAEISQLPIDIRHIYAPDEMLCHALNHVASIDLTAALLRAIRRIAKKAIENGITARDVQTFLHHSPFITESLVRVQQFFKSISCQDCSVVLPLADTSSALLKPPPMVSTYFTSLMWMALLDESHFKVCMSMSMTCNVTHEFVT